MQAHDDDVAEIVVTAMGRGSINGCRRDDKGGCAKGRATPNCLDRVQKGADHATWWQCRARCGDVWSDGTSPTRSLEEIGAADYLERALQEVQDSRATWYAVLATESSGCLQSWRCGDGQHWNDPQVRKRTYYLACVLGRPTMFSGILRSASGHHLSCDRDIVVSSQHGNIMDPAVRAFWVHGARQGIHSFVAGPPCETWSQARGERSWRWWWRLQGAPGLEDGCKAMGLFSWAKCSRGVPNGETQRVSSGFMPQFCIINQRQHGLRPYWWQQWPNGWLSGGVSAAGSQLVQQNNGSWFPWLNHVEMWEFTCRSQRKLRHARLKNIYIYIYRRYHLSIGFWVVYSTANGMIICHCYQQNLQKHNWWGAKDVPFTPCDGQIGLKGMALGNHRMCGPPTGMCGKLILTVEIRVKDLFKEEGIIFAGLCFVMSRWAIDDHCF